MNAINTMYLKMLPLASDEPFGYEADVFISTIAFTITGALFKFVHAYCATSLPEWEKFSKSLQDRMCVELAIIPLRFGFIYFSISTVLTAFTSPANWTGADTRNSLIACSLMTGAYLYDLFIHRDDILSIIHHCMGPALLLWIRASFSSFDSSDSLICRPLMMFVFFGAGIAGTASSSAVFLLRIGKNYMPSERLYRYFAPCLAALTISTVLSCYLNTWYLLHAYQGLYGHFGIAYIGPVTWEGFECYLQWRWLFRFHQLEKRFWDGKKGSKIADSGSPSVTPLDSMKNIRSLQAVRASMFPSWTVPTLKFLTVGWLLILTVVVWKLACSIYQDNVVSFVN